MLTRNGTTTTLRWRWISWPEVAVYLAAFVIAPLFVDSSFAKPWLLVPMVTGIFFGLGCMHWVVAPRGFRRVALIYGETGFTHPRTSKREIPWRAVSRIRDPGRIGRTTLVSLTDTSYRPPPPRFMTWLSPKPECDVVIMLEGWKIKADMQVVADDFKRLRDQAKT